MKQIFKNYFKLGVLLFGISLTLVNCQKDDAEGVKEEQNIDSNYQVVSLEEIPNLIPVIQNVKRVLPKASTSINRDGVEFIGLDNVNVEEIIKITNESNKSTYSFRIDDPNYTGINFENLHLVQVDGGYMAYILSYEPNEEWYYSTYTPEGELVFDMSNYSGDITKYNLQRGVIWSTKLSDISRGQTMEECTISLEPTCFNDGYGGIGSEHLAGDKCNGPFGSTWVETCSTVYVGGGGSADTTGGGGGASDTEPPCIPGADGTNTQVLSGNFVGDDGNVSEETTLECVENDVTGVMVTQETITFYDSLTDAQKIWWDTVATDEEKATIFTYLFLNPEDISFAQQAVEVMRNDPSVTFEQCINWFGTEIEGQDFFYDALYWENPNLTFPQQDLPTWDDYNTHYPRNADGSLVDTDQLYINIGGDVLQARIDYPGLPTDNTCALRVSAALNGANIAIPQINSTADLPGTLKGDDGKYYFLNAKALNIWMRKTFGTNPATATTPLNSNHTHYNAMQIGVNGTAFLTSPQMQNTKGIYSMVLTTDYAGGYGHADIFDNKVAGIHFALKLYQDIEYIDIWVLD